MGLRDLFRKKSETKKEETQNKVENTEESSEKTYKIKIGSSPVQVEINSISSLMNQKIAV